MSKTNEPTTQEIPVESAPARPKDKLSEKMDRGELERLDRSISTTARSIAADVDKLLTRLDDALKLRRRLDGVDARSTIRLRDAQDAAEKIDTQVRRLIGLIP